MFSVSVLGMVILLQKIAPGTAVTPRRKEEAFTKPNPGRYGSRNQLPNPHGMAKANIFGCLFFGGISGSFVFKSNLQNSKC